MVAPWPHLDLHCQGSWLKGPACLQWPLGPQQLREGARRLFLWVFDQVPSKLLRSQTSSPRGTVIGVGTGAKVRGTVLPTRM